MNDEAFEFEIAANDAALEDYLGALLAPLVNAAPAPVPTDDMRPADDVRPVDAAPRANGARRAVPMLECLLIKAAGITLAVRREDVSTVRPWPIDYTIANGGGGRIGGEWPHEGLQVTLVDTARVILPAAGQAALAPLPGRAHEVLLLTNGQWGLVSESASRPLAIGEDHIHWRGERGRRPWLAGMVSEPQCALLDVAGLIALLDPGNDAERLK